MSLLHLTITIADTITIDPLEMSSALSIRAVTLPLSLLHPNDHQLIVQWVNLMGDIMDIMMMVMCVHGYLGGCK